jgi:hypothetical protein
MKKLFLYTCMGEKIVHIWNTRCDSSPSKVTCFSWEHAPMEKREIYEDLETLFMKTPMRWTKDSGRANNKTSIVARSDNPGRKSAGVGCFNFFSLAKTTYIRQPVVQKSFQVTISFYYIFCLFTDLLPLYFGAPSLRGVSQVIQYQFQWPSHDFVSRSWIFTSSQSSYDVYTCNMFEYTHMALSYSSTLNIPYTDKVSIFIYICGICLPSFFALIHAM